VRRQDPAPAYAKGPIARTLLFPNVSREALSMWTSQFNRPGNWSMRSVASETSASKKKEETVHEYFAARLAGCSPLMLSASPGTTAPAPQPAPAQPPLPRRCTDVNADALAALNKMGAALFARCLRSEDRRHAGGCSCFRREAAIRGHS
jgi:hypothetical protein